MSCPDCFKGGKANGIPKGYMKTIAGVQTYVAGAPSSATSQSTIIFYTDVFGLLLLNNKLLADDYASATGFRVLVPDIIPGGALSPDLMEIMDRVTKPVSIFNLWGQTTRLLNIFRAATYFIPFHFRGGPRHPNSLKACLEYARKIKADLPNGAKLGVAGFCWGGYQTLHLSTHASVAGGSGPLVDAQFSTHPSGIKMPTDIVNAVTKFKVPVAIAQAHNDFVTPTKIEETEAVLRQNVGVGDSKGGFNYQSTIYKDVGHGFAVRAILGIMWPLQLQI